MITVHDPELAERLRKLRQHAMDLSDLARHSAARRRLRALSRARLELPHDRHAGGARALPARGARRDPRRAHAARPTRYTAALDALPALRGAVRPAARERTWQSYASASTAQSPIDRTELMRRLLRDGVATRRGVMAIHHEAAYAGAVLRPARTPKPRRATC